MSEQPTKLSLQVGKKYRNRNGDVVSIVKCVPEFRTYPYRSSENVGYQENGRWYSDKSTDENDLIEEVVEPAPPLREPSDTDFVVAWDNQSADLHATARDRGFYTGGVKPLEYSLNWMHAELGEVFTALQQGGPASDKIEGFSQVEEELADVVILLMDAARAHGLRVAEAVVAKNAYNLTRPYKHGKVL